MQKIWGNRPLEFFKRSHQICITTTHECVVTKLRHMVVGGDTDDEISIAIIVKDDLSWNAVLEKVTRLGGKRNAAFPIPIICIQKSDSEKSHSLAQTLSKSVNAACFIITTEPVRFDLISLKLAWRQLDKSDNDILHVNIARHDRGETTFGFGDYLKCKANISGLQIRLPTFPSALTNLLFRRDTFHSITKSLFELQLSLFSQNLVLARIFETRPLPKSSPLFIGYFDGDENQEEFCDNGIIEEISREEIESIVASEESMFSTQLPPDQSVFLRGIYRLHLTRYVTKLRATREIDPATDSVVMKSLETTSDWFATAVQRAVDDRQSMLTFGALVADELRLPGLRSMEISLDAMERRLACTLHDAYVFDCFDTTSGEELQPLLAALESTTCANVSPYPPKPYELSMLFLGLMRNLDNDDNLDLKPKIERLRYAFYARAKAWHDSSGRTEKLERQLSETQTRHEQEYPGRVALTLSKIIRRLVRLSQIRSMKGVFSSLRTGIKKSGSDGIYIKENDLDQVSAADPVRFSRTIHGSASEIVILPLQASRVAFAAFISAKIKTYRQWKRNR